MHGAFLALAVAALLPFLITLAVLLAITVVGAILLAPLAVGSHGGGAEILIDAKLPVVRAGNRFLVAPYYRFLARRRHPLFWGTGGGVLLGALLLWALIGAVVLPGEARTTKILIDAKDRIEHAYQDGHGFPTSLAVF